MDKQWLADRYELLSPDSSTLFLSSSSNNEMGSTWDFQRILFVLWPMCTMQTAVVQWIIGWMGFNQNFSSKYCTSVGVSFWSGWNPGAVNWTVPPNAENINVVRVECVNTKKLKLLLMTIYEVIVLCYCFLDLVRYSLSPWVGPKRGREELWLVGGLSAVSPFALPLPPPNRWRIWLH